MPDVPYSPVVPDVFGLLRRVGRALAASLLAASSLAACGDVEPDPPLVPVTPVFDVELGALPSPNDLERPGGPLDGPPPPGLSGTDLAVIAWRRSLDGHPRGTPLRVRFDGPVDPASAAAALSVRPLAGGPPLPLPGRTLSGDGRVLEVPAPAGGFAPGEPLVVAIPRALRDAAGGQVEPSPHFFWVRGETALDSDEAAEQLPGADPLRRRELGVRLEAVRLALAPAVDLLAGSLPREELALAWVFTESAAPMALRAAGEEPTGPVALPSDAPVRFALVAPSPLARPPDVFVLDLGPRGGALATPRMEVEGGSVLLWPGAGGWPEGRTLFVAVTGGTDGAGRALAADETFARLRARAPIADDAGRSLAAGVADDVAAGLEAERRALAPGLERLEHGGLPREHVALAFTLRIDEAE